ncbi:MAG: hypothetical protein KJ065_07230 [Anaerolineae bacterium]|nr:hypothetical protein [Anaerolineae bacterium]
MLRPKVMSLANDHHNVLDLTFKAKIGTSREEQRSVFPPEADVLDHLKFASSTNMPDSRPLFTVLNYDIKSCGKPPHIDGDIRKRYHGYYENEYCEHAIFVYDYEVNKGTLWMGDSGWERRTKS